MRRISILLAKSGSKHRYSPMFERKIVYATPNSPSKYGRERGAVTDLNKMRGGNHTVAKNTRKSNEKDCSKAEKACVTFFLHSSFGTLL